MSWWGGGTVGRWDGEAVRRWGGRLRHLLRIVQNARDRQHGGDGGSREGLGVRGVGQPLLGSAERVNVLACRLPVRREKAPALVLWVG